MEPSHIYQQQFYTQMGGDSLRPATTTLPAGLPYHYQQRAVLHATPTQQNKPEQIDELVAMELQHLKTHYQDEEQRYVDQMLRENPIVVERRVPPKPETTKSATPKANSRDAQQQRAESCRKSRFNNKIKKAKLRFRHKFVCNQLTESANVLDYMRDIVAQAEAQLLARGFNHAALESLRQNFGVERCSASAMDTSAVAAAATAAMAATETTMLD